MSPDIEQVPYERPLVEAVDKLVEVAKLKCSPNKQVESEGDWEMISLIFALYETFYPQDCNQFLEDIKKTRQTQINGAIAKDGEAMIQHQMNLPLKFHDILKTFYPNQKLTKEFTKKLFQRMPQFRVAEKR